MCCEGCPKDEDVISEVAKHSERRGLSAFYESLQYEFDMCVKRDGVEDMRRQHSIERLKDGLDRLKNG